MSGPETIAASAPIGGIGDGKGTAFIQVQNEDELRLAQMGKFSTPRCWGIRC